MTIHDRETSRASASNKVDWNLTAGMHPDLLATKRLAYEQNGYTCSTPRKEAESAEYGAYAFELNGHAIRFRVAKITPTKVGHFVTLWKRIGTGPIQPFDVADTVDLFIISTRNAEHFGQFIFPKDILCRHDIVSMAGKGGKRAMRVYPPWVETTNRQAQKTQDWQSDYFLELPQDRPVDQARLQLLYQI